MASKKIARPSNEPRDGRRRGVTSPIQAQPEEKVIKETRKTVRVRQEPAPGKRARRPMPLSALDQRKQFSGTDEPASERDRRRKPRD